MTNNGEGNPMTDNEQATCLPDIEWVMVGPEMAATMLARNTHNRNVKSKHHQYSEDMRSGAWRHEVGDPLRFSAEGVLLDGQNRLLAVIEAGVTIPFLVVRNLHSDTQTVMDSGVPRSFRDVLHLQGEPHADILSSVTRLAWEWERGVSYLTKGRASNSQLLTFLDAHPELRDFANQRSKTVSDSCKLPTALIGCLWWVFDGIDEEDAEYFFQRLGDPTGHEAREPIYELRRTLLAAFEGAKSRRGQRDRVWMMAVTVKAWNAYRAGDSVAIYRWKPGGKNPEAFPSPK